MREHPLPVGAWLHVISWHGLLRKDSHPFDLKVRAPVRAVIPQGNKALRRVNVNAILFLCEVRPASSARGENQAGVAAVRRDPNEIGIRGLSTVKGAVFAIVGVATQ